MSLALTIGMIGAVAAQDEAMGLTTLLGESTLTSMNCYSPGDVMANIQEASFSLTGGDGDEISGTWSGDCTPSLVTEPAETYQCHGVPLVTEGTGAFEGATGQIVMMFRALACRSRRKRGVSDA